MAWMPRPIRFARPAGSSGGGAARTVRRGRVWAPRAVLWLAGSTIVAGVVLVQLGDGGVPALRRLRSQDAELSGEVDGLVKRNAELRQELQSLKDDPETLERLAREKAGMKRPGEAVLVVLPASEPGDR